MGSTSYSAAPGTAGNGQICFFDGFLKQMLNDTVITGTNMVTTSATPAPGQLIGVGALTDGDTVAASSPNPALTNIADAFNALLQLVAANKKALLANAKRYERMKFLVSTNTEQVWDTFITTTQTFKGVNTTERGINKFKGYEIVPLAGLPDDTIIFCEAVPDTSSNLWLGMNSVLDENLKLQRLQNNSELFFLKGLMKFSVNYGFSEEIFLYTTLTTEAFTQ